MTIVASRSSWSLPALLEARAAELGDAPLATFDLGGEGVGYADAWDASRRLATGLARLGVGPGDHVALMLRNRAEFLLAWFATNLAGAAQVPVNVDYRGAFLEHVLNTARSRVLVVEGDLVEVVAASAERLPHLEVVVVVGDGTSVPGLPVRSFGDLADAPADALPGVTSRDVAAVLFTSGTTGPAKGALVTHAQAHLLAERAQSILRAGAGDVVLTHLPLFHVNAQVLTVYLAMLVGGSAHVATHFSASGWLGDVRRTGATHTALLGVMLPFLLDRPETDVDADNRLDCVWTVPCPQQPAERLARRFGVTRIVSSYGSTEVGMVASRDHDPARLPSPGPVADDWYETRLVDPRTDEEVPDGHVGELLVRPRVPWTTTPGYLGMPERTVGAFRNLWFHTGDALRRDEDGWLWFVDRLGDRIRRRGENVSSLDVEMALQEHPDVEAAAVVGVPTEAEAGEDEILAHVEPAAGVDRARLPDTLWDFCQERLPYFAVPRYLVLADGLPRTATGKIRKDDLRRAGVPRSAADRGPVTGRLSRRRPT